jgi:hypothetical protein
MACCRAAPKSANGRLADHTDMKRAPRRSRRVLRWAAQTCFSLLLTKKWPDEPRYTCFSCRRVGATRAACASRVCRRVDRHALGPLAEWQPVTRTVANACRRAVQQRSKRDAWLRGQANPPLVPKPKISPLAREDGELVRPPLGHAARAARAEVRARPLAPNKCTRRRAAPKIRKRASRVAATSQSVLLVPKYSPVRT